jgi:transposase
MTLKLLWKEYIRDNPSGYSYSQYCRQYHLWLSQRDVVMRQEHIAGEKLFVDFVGMKVPIVCRHTGEVKQASIFVAVFGASNYFYAEAVESEELRNWLGVHVRALRFFGGVPKYVVPDNLKSAVIDAKRFDPVLNKSFVRLAQHYGFGIMPARPYRPRDKAKVEKCVQVVEQAILAPLRNVTFFSLEDLNREIGKLVSEINNEPFQKLSGCRRSWFEAVDAPALNPLPQRDFEFENWCLTVKVPKDYHISVDKHYYSVPYQLVGEIVDVRYTDSTIEVLHRNVRVASHMRSWAEGKKTTQEEHMPAAHAAYQGMSAQKFIEWAQNIGPATEAIIKHILESKPQPQLCFDQCWGILRSLSKKYGSEAVEKACCHALSLHTPGYRVVKTILERGVDKLPEQLSLDLSKISHGNIRGPNHFN